MITVIRTHGASNGGTRTRPPGSDARVATASASSTPKVTLQWAARHARSAAIGLTLADDVDEVRDAPICAIRSRRPGSRSSR